MLNDLIPDNDELHSLDLSRLSSVKAERVRYAESYADPYFQEITNLRGLWPPDEIIDEYILEMVKDRSVQHLLDVGTGAGRILKVLASFIEKGTGIDLSLIHI